MEARLSGRSTTGIETYRLKNDMGLCADIMNYGARIHRLFIPNNYGTFTDIVAGFDEIDDYRTPNPYFNAVIGRVANRIGKAKFILNDKTYELNKNDNGNCLHGGLSGFNDKMWKCENCSVIDGAPSVTLSYFSPDGEENFPGNLKISVTYTLKDNTFSIRYHAETDADTPCNLTNHAYFNLDGRFLTVRRHVVSINSHLITQPDSELVSTGKILDVSDTPLDFRAPKKIGRDCDSEYSLLKLAKGGYDFNYILENNDEPAATAYSNYSGITMSVKTDRPCLQFYTGNFLDGTIRGKKKFVYQSAFCMETQGYPNACNVPEFPSDIITPEKPFDSTTVFSFKWE